LVLHLDIAEEFVALVDQHDCTLPFARRSRLTHLKSCTRSGTAAR
jgi:hypothetical protein